MQSTDLPTCHAVTVNKSSYSYVQNLAELHNDERWGWHSGSIGSPSASSTLNTSNNINYSINNIQDLDLSTAWIEGKQDYGIGESFEFALTGKYRIPYSFSGVIEIFNEYCKSEDIWLTNSRVESMKVTYNSTELNKIRKLSVKNEESFLEKWNEYFN